mgnify:CR=1 FL=1
MIHSWLLMGIHVKGKFKKMLLAGTIAAFEPLRDETVF